MMNIFVVVFLLF